MGDIFHEDFEDINSYVPRFYLQPLKSSENYNVTNVTQQEHTYSEFPKYLQWYIRPSKELNYEGNVNRHELSRPEENTIYDSLVNKLITDHGWKLEDFDILNNKAKLLMTKYVHEYRERIENKETSDRNYAPAYHSKGIRGQIGINQYQQFEENHAINENFQEEFKSHRSLNSTRRYLGLEMFYKQSHNAYNRYRERFWSPYKNVAEFDTHFLEEVNHTLSQNLYSEGKYCQQTLAHDRGKKTVFTNNIGQTRPCYGNCDVGFMNRNYHYHTYTSYKNLEYIYISKRRFFDVHRKFLTNKETFNKTYKASEETQHFTIPVKSKNESPTTTIIQKNGEENCSFFSNFTGNISSQKVFKAKSKLTENLVPFEIDQNAITRSKITSQDIRKTEEYTSSWEKEHQLNNLNPLKSFSNELYNHSTNYKSDFTGTGTEILPSARERLGIQNKQQYTDNTVRKTKPTYVKEIPISSKYYEISNGVQTPYEGFGKQESRSQLRPKTLFVQEKIDRIMNVLNQSKQDYITSRNSKNINSSAGINKSLSNAQSLTVLESRQNNNNDKNFEGLRKSTFYNGIISTLKSSQHQSKSNGKLEHTNLASLIKSVLQGCSQFIRTEKLASSTHHPQSSAIPLLTTNSKEVQTFTTEISATPSKENQLSLIEKHTPLGLPNPSESTNVKLKNSNFNSNTVLYSEYLNSERKPLQSESSNLRLEDWALKSQLFSEIIKSKEKANASTYKSLENLITTQEQISNESRKFEENGDLKNVYQPGLKSGMYVSQPTIQKLPLFPQKTLCDGNSRSRIIETESSHQTMESTTYDQRNLSKGFSSQPKIKSYVKQHQRYLHRRKVTFKNMNFRRTNIKRVNNKIHNSRLNNTLPIRETSLESLWHDQKMKRVYDKMRAIRINKTKKQTVLDKNNGV